MFRATRGDITDRRIDGRTTILGKDDAFDPKESGKAKQRTKVLRILNLIQCQPQSSFAFRNIPQFFKWQRRRWFDRR